MPHVPLGKAAITTARGDVRLIDSNAHAFIAAHPFWAILIALAAGLLVGAALF